MQVSVLSHNIYGLFSSAFIADKNVKPDNQFVGVVIIVDRG